MTASSAAASQIPSVEIPRPTIDINTFRRDPKLGGASKRAGNYVAWDALHAAADGLPMTEEQFGIYRQCTQRADRPSKPFSLVVEIIGRQGGKTDSLADRTVHRATCYDWSSQFGPGEFPVFPLTCPDRIQSSIILDRIRGKLEASPILRNEIAAATSEMITLRNGVRIQVRTASYRSIRGIRAPFGALDEAAFFMSDEHSRNTDKALWAAYVPATASVRGSQTVISSTPRARQGLLWSMYRKWYGVENDKVLVWVAPTTVMNPSIDQSVIDEALIDDPADARAEFYAQWRDDLEAYVSAEIVDSVTSRGVYERPRLDGRRYWGFCDPSGGVADQMVLAIASRGAGNAPATLDLVREKRPPFNPRSVVEEFSVELRRYGLGVVTGDRYGAEWVSQAFRDAGVTYRASELSKSEIYRELLPLVTTGAVDLLDHKRLASELTGLERRVSRGGRESVDHMPGGHDDVANACGGALVLAGKRRSTGPIRIQVSYA